MRIIVTGLVAQYPFGGVTWDYLHYVFGFQQLGHEVYYLEDSGCWPYDPIKQTFLEDCSYNVQFLKQVAEFFQLQGRWAYRNGADGAFYGMEESAIRQLLKTCDVLVDVSNGDLIQRYDIGAKCSMFIDGDPMFTQIALAQKESRPGLDAIRAHDIHFTFALNINQPDCLIPNTGLHWRPTVQPIALEYWSPAKEAHNGCMTTVMNWASYQPVIWNEKTYGHKDLSFEEFQDLPLKTSQKFKLAMGEGSGRRRPTESLNDKGWNIVEPDVVVPDFKAYRTFLSESMAEWSIAKQAYVVGQTGWFSGRSGCYLALGKPVLIQDTDWSKHLPAGEGVIAFSTIDDCLKGIESIQNNYEKHRYAARAFAEKYLSADCVCAQLLKEAGF